MTTPAQLDHLAELADFAAGFFVLTDPSASRRFTEAAVTARQLSEQLTRRELLDRIRSELTDVRCRLDRRARRCESLDPFGQMEQQHTAGSGGLDL